MDDFRSHSSSGHGGRMQLESYSGHGVSGSGGGGLRDLRCYSASYTDRQAPPPPAKELKKGKSTNSSLSKAWCFSDPELQRKKRVASYKVYSAEGKMKGSFRKSFRWVKDIVHAWW